MMTLVEFLRLSGPNRKKGSGLVLIKLLACGDQEELFKLKAEFMVHMVDVRKRHNAETDAVQKDELAREVAALEYPSKVIEVAPALRETFEHVVGHGPDYIAQMYTNAQLDFAQLLKESER